MLSRSHWAFAFAASAVALAAGPSGAEEGAKFPESLDRETLVSWLRRETDITPAQVLAVTPPAVTAIVSTFPGAGGEPSRIVIRAEALSSETYGRTGALSWHVSLSADCQQHRLRMGETTGYAERNLLGERRQLRPADAVWRAPEPGTALESAWRAACDPTFSGPLGDGAPLVTAGSDAPFRKVKATPADPAPSVVAASEEASQSSPKPAPKAIVKAAPPVAIKGSLPIRAMSATAPRPAALRPAGPGVAQLGAYGNAAQAQAVLAGVRSKLAGHGTRVETVSVGGKTWNRALVTGFADSAAAARFCRTLGSAAPTCMAKAK